MSSEEPPGKDKITFKSVKRKRPIRVRKESSDEEEESVTDSGILSETLERQKLRVRSTGINAFALNSGIKASDHELSLVKDPFKLKTGGLLDYKTAQKAAAAESEKDDLSAAVGTQFSKETQIRDEDEEMRKFIEIEMKKRKGDDTNGDTAGTAADTYLSPEDQALRSLPAHLSTSTFRKNEEMLSSQMLSGIPEVDLGIDEKIRNIEATEIAKKKQKIEEIKKINEKPSDFVPKNMTVNFDHKRFAVSSNNRKSNDKNTEAETEVIERTCVVGSVPEERVKQVNAKNNTSSVGDRATDDMHLTNFKKQFQRK